MSPAIEISCCLLFPLFQLLTMGRFLRGFFWYPRRRSVRWAAWAVYYVLTAAMRFWGDFPPLALLVMNAGLLFLVSTFSYYSDLKKRCLFSVLLMAVWMVVEIIVKLALSLLGMEGWGLDIAGGVIANMCMFAGAVITEHYANREEAPELSIQYMAAVILIPSGTIYIMNHIFLMAEEQEEYTAFAICSGFVLLLMNYTAFAIYEWMVREAGARERSLLYEQELELLTRQMAEREAHDRQIRRLRHDMKNHMIGLLGMMEAGNCGQAEAYIRFLLKSSGSDKAQDASHSGNPAVDAIVNDKCRQAREEGIGFAANVFIPSVLPFRAGDLAIVFGNLLDNALEACRQLEREDRWISLEAFYRKEVLMITVKNSCTNRKKGRGGRFFTTKKDRQNHGLGLVSVESAAESYQGQLEVEYQDGRFQAVVVMYGTQGENDI